MAKTDNVKPESARVNEPSEAYKSMVEGWNLIDALHSGTQGMRDLDVKYLPKEPREPSDAYAMRVERSILFPGLKRAIRNLTGKAFASAVSFKDGTMNSQWEEWFKNIDLAGTPLSQFAQQVFLSGLKYGHTALFAELPKVPSGATLYDERQVIKSRPYLCHREARSIIGWRTQIKDSYQQISRVRMREEITQYEDQWDDDGCATQVRVVEPGLYEVWQEDEDGNWFRIESGAVSIKDRIPITPVYFDHQGTLMSKPAFEDLAWTNVGHWQSYSDQRTILRVARVPMMLVTGADKDEIGDSITVGVSSFTALRNPQATMSYVEHTAADINAGRQDCVNLEERMAMQAAEPMIERAGSDTATGRTLDARDATSPMAAWVSAFEWALNDAFKNMAEYAGTDKAPEAQMSRDWGIIGQTTDLDVLFQSRTSGEISRQTFLAELKRRGVLSETFDAEADAEKLAEEPPMAQPEPGGFGDDGGKPSDANPALRKGEGDNVGNA